MVAVEMGLAGALEATATARGASATGAVEVEVEVVQALATAEATLAAFLRIYPQLWQRPRVAPIQPEFRLKLRPCSSQPHGLLGCM